VIKLAFFGAKNRKLSNVPEENELFEHSSKLPGSFSFFNLFLINPHKFSDRIKEKKAEII